MRRALLVVGSLPERAIALVLPQATQFVNDSGSGWRRRIRNLCARGAAGRDFDLIRCKSDFD